MIDFMNFVDFVKDLFKKLFECECELPDDLPDPCDCNLNNEFIPRLNRSVPIYRSEKHYLFLSSDKVTVGFYNDGHEEEHEGITINEDTVKPENTKIIRIIKGQYTLEILPHGEPRYDFVEIKVYKDRELISVISPVFPEGLDIEPLEEGVDLIVNDRVHITLPF